eukprot:scaffold658966_cov57-Prasinocladus_malaysianus.AAC.1
MHQVQRELSNMAGSFEKLIFLTAGSSSSEVDYLKKLLQGLNKNKYVVRTASSNESQNIRDLFGFAQQVIEQVVVKYYHKGKEVASSTFIAHGGGKQKELAKSALTDVNNKMKSMNVMIKFH